MNILYVHGLASSGASGTAANLRKYLPNDRIVAPDFPIDPDEAIAKINKTVEEEKIDLIIGTSMGGMLAQKIRWVKKILVNPAMHVSRLLRSEIGTVNYLNPRQDGATSFEITPDICRRFEELEEDQEYRIAAGLEPEISIALFGDHDDVVDCWSDFDGKYPWMERFDGGHRLTEQNVRDVIVPAVEKMRSLEWVEREHICKNPPGAKLMYKTLRRDSALWGEPRETDDPAGCKDIDYRVDKSSLDDFLNIDKEELSRQLREDLATVSGISEDFIKSVHGSSLANEERIKATDGLCGCFCCGKIFSKKRIVDWIGEGAGRPRTAICPYCGVDSIITSEQPDGSRIEINDRLLQLMKTYYF